MTPKDQEFKMVPLNGLEPLLPCGNQILSPRLEPQPLLLLTYVASQRGVR